MIRKNSINWFHKYLSDGMVPTGEYYNGIIMVYKFAATKLLPCIKAVTKTLIKVYSACRHHPVGNNTVTNKPLYTINWMVHAGAI